jgi:hypothetical protein
VSMRDHGFVFLVSITTTPSCVFELPFCRETPKTIVGRSVLGFFFSTSVPLLFFEAPLARCRMPEGRGPRPRAARGEGGRGKKLGSDVVWGSWFESTYLPPFF